MLDLIADGFAPTNNLLGNPAAMKKMYESGGQSVLKGLKNAYDDLRFGNGLPTQVDTRPFVLGENIAGLAGKVVFRNAMLEVIQYSPKTESVNKIPLLVVPPQINKFYVLDLSADKSLFKFLVENGHQVFAVSWRNPDETCSHWGLADYVDALIEASDVVRKISRQKKINVSGACSGGITLASFLSQLLATKDTRINSMSQMVCVTDPQQDDTEIGLFLDDNSIKMARRASAKAGVLKGEELARTFAWMRPNDLIWNYVVNNYLLGEDPPAFDILAWNADTTNLPARLHSDYLDLYVKGPFRNPGTMELNGHPLDISNLALDCFCVSGTTDHITPWRACYRSANLMKGNTTFVLSNSGHIQSLINPPSNSRARYSVALLDGGPANEWLERATVVDESWWLLWSKWLEERGGGKKAAPKKLGNKAYPALDDAPGRYVRDN